MENMTFLRKLISRQIHATTEDEADIGIPWDTASLSGR